MTCGPYFFRRNRNLGTILGRFPYMWAIVTSAVYLLYIYTVYRGPLTSSIWLAYANGTIQNASPNPITLSGNSTPPKTTIVPPQSWLAYRVSVCYHGINSNRKTSAASCPPYRGIVTSFQAPECAASGLFGGWDGTSNWVT